METRILRKTALLCGILLIGILIMGQSAMAAKWGDTPSGQDCIITEVFVDFETDPKTVTIHGLNFECENLIVTLGDYGSINFTSCSPDPDNEIIMELPTDIQDGDYTLTIQTGSSVHQYDTYNLTIGAVGPEGPQGEAGTIGLTGPQGPIGPVGPQGPQGTAGADGAPGPQGEVGATGSQGPQGAPGPQGIQGEQGPPGADGVCDCPITQEQIDDLIARIECLESLAARFTDMGNGTIRDNDTGLIWLKDANCFYPISWSDAMDQAALLAAGQCGLTDGSMAGDWRLPTKAEWEAFYSTVYDDPALVNTTGNAQWSEGDAFTGVQSDNYWSSTEYDSDSAWYAIMMYGNMNYKSSIMDPDYCVWPVRSGND